MGFAAPASAEVGAAVSVFSDARLRGYSLSAGQPVAALDLSYDDPGGLYGAVSASAVANDGVHPLGIQLSGGYARRLSSGPVLDAGIIHSNYSDYGSRGSSGYTEVYAGAIYKFLSARIAYSPHYFEAGRQTVYGELEANVNATRRLRLDAHVGLLVPLTYPDEGAYGGSQHDWRIGSAYELGPLSLHAILTGGGPGRDYYRGRYRDRTAVVLGVSCRL
jgi:uncharacterized protein (TIGR02001 family)